MKIANPLYDHAFKYLMSNDRYAKKVLSTILGETVLSLELSQQEMIVKDEIRHFTLYRLDFKALIEKADGSQEKVLIELQKSKLPTNVLRFRSYLGMTYVQKKQNKEATAEQLPIVSIYILGYKVADIPLMGVMVDRKIINASTGEEISLKSDFINLLTHRCYILQANRLPKERKTKLERFMMLFNQAWVSEKGYILDLEEVPEGFTDIAKYLQAPLLDEQMQRHLSAEEELEDFFANQEAQLAQAKQEMVKAKAREEEERRQKEEAKAREEEERRQKEEAKLRLAKKMLEYGESVQEIMKETGLNKAAIENLK